MFTSANSWEFFWKTVGLSGQALFGLRLLVQWYASEKARRSVIPLSFWYISVIAGWILLLYAIYRVEPIFIIGFVINFLIYIRNLDLVFRDHSHAQRGLLWLNAAVLLAAAGMYAVFGPKAAAAHESPHIAFWYIWGLTGQICFNLRFPLQWLHSEARGHSEMPPVFWYLSLIGSLILLSYAVFLWDMVFIIGQAFGFTVYIRNIALLRRGV
jgi:lipid-A-disaccharide synthase-like uncharacterized protein